MPSFTIFDILRWELCRGSNVNNIHKLISRLIILHFSKTIHNEITTGFSTFALYCLKITHARFNFSVQCSWVALFPSPSHIPMPLFILSQKLLDFSAQTMANILNSRKTAISGSRYRNTVLTSCHVVPLMDVAAVRHQCRKALHIFYFLSSTLNPFSMDSHKGLKNKFIASCSTIILSSIAVLVAIRRT